MKKTFSDLVLLMERLRAPGGCPWDREQTFETLRPFIIEEAYEVVDAIDQKDMPHLKEEIGDLLLQSVFLAEVGRESGSFDIDDCTTAIHDKLVRRHPHVFGDQTVESAGEVLVNWEKLKQQERAAEKKGVLTGVPSALPALLKATRLTEKAARVGFDWNRVDDVFGKLEEEISEVRVAIREENPKAVEEEIGDLLFTIVNIARKVDVNAEGALQGANRKFQRRFEAMEHELSRTSQRFEELSIDELDILWTNAKKSLAEMS